MRRRLAQQGQTKQCAVCGAFKPLSDFYRYPPHLQTHGDSEGYRSSCKDCTRLARQHYRRENRPRLAAYMRAYRAQVKAEREITAYVAAYGANKSKTESRQCGH